MNDVLIMAKCLVLRVLRYKDKDKKEYFERFLKLDEQLGKLEHRASPMMMESAHRYLYDSSVVDLKKLPNLNWLLSSLKPIQNMNKTQSRSEKEILDILTKLSIPVIAQNTVILDNIDVDMLLSNNIIIEVNGSHHYTTSHTDITLTHILDGHTCTHTYTGDDTVRHDRLARYGYTVAVIDTRVMMAMRNDGRANDLIDHVKMLLVVAGVKMEDR